MAVRLGALRLVSHGWRFLEVSVALGGYRGRGRWVPATTSFTWQALAGVGYRWDWGDLILAYRHLSYDMGSDKLLQNTEFSGPALGVVFRF